MEIYRSAKQWNLMEVVPKEICKRHPDDPINWNNLAWVVLRAVGIKEPFEILSKAAEKFPEAAAKERVGKAIKLDGKFRLLALDDVNLEPMWKVRKL